jgi:hypothetical protein
MEHVSQLRGKKKRYEFKQQLHRLYGSQSEVLPDPVTQLERQGDAPTDSSRRASFQGFKVQLIVLVDV